MNPRSNQEKNDDQREQDHLDSLAQDDMAAMWKASKVNPSVRSPNRERFEQLAQVLGIYTAHFERWTAENVEHRKRIGEPVVLGEYVSGVLQDCWRMFSAVESLNLLAEANPRPQFSSPNDQMTKWAIRELLESLPESRDWFNPEAERHLRSVVAP